MKVKELFLRNYKAFGHDQSPFSFCDGLGNPNAVTVIAGNNGSGKSSILQAIACLVGSAVRNRMSPELMNWPGFNLDFIQNGRMSLQMEVDVTFDEDEIKATRDFANQIFTEQQGKEKPANRREVKLSLDLPNGKVKAPTSPQFFQFRGYEYALQLHVDQGKFVDNLRRVGNIYWYTEQRTATSIQLPERRGTQATSPIDDPQLRKILSEWDAFHSKALRQGFALRDGQRDRFQTLKELYESVFPGRTLLGAEPHTDPSRVLDAPLFFFQDEKNREYELSMVSAGERAILPLLIDFANWEINNSIILIDEIELHLHPPLQQMLVKALPKLGNNNQFIITTHSDHVVALFDEEETIRL